MKKIYLFGLCLFAGFTLAAQNEDTEKGDKKFENLEYMSAIEEYAELVEDGEATPYVYKQLARAHFILFNTKQAEQYYGIVVMKGNAEPEDFYRYAEMLKVNGKISEAKEWMGRFVEMAPDDPRAVAYQNNPNYLSEIMGIQPNFTAQKLGINTGGYDFGGHIYDGKFYFVSSRNKSRKDYGYQQPTLDIYVAEGSKGLYQNPKLLEGDVNSKYNEGTVSIAEDGQTMYFTRNDYYDGDYEASEEGISELKIFSAKWIAGEWTQIEPLPFNSSEYSTGHTALSPDGKILYFSSNMPGGLGESDLYKVNINEDGSYGEPQSLGPQINTPGHESFAFVAKDGTLYFASDGHLGLGGLDIFKAKPQGNGFATPKNLGTPINSKSDDFAFTYYPEDKMAFVSSNRGTSGGNDDIYVLRPIEGCDTEIMVTVVDAETQQPIAGAGVRVYAPGGRPIATETASPQGNADFKLTCDNYQVQADAKGYFSAAINAPKQKRGETLELTIALSPEPVVTETEVILNPIFFEFDKAEITPEAALELDRLVRLMEERQELKIQVRAHTDFRGSDSYNLNLSDRRAKATAQYIISQGIDKSRITGKGFGETMPEVECGTDCTEEQHAKNRRSEFRIVNK